MLVIRPLAAAIAGAVIAVASLVPLGAGVAGADTTAADATATAVAPTQSTPSPTALYTHRAQIKAARHHLTVDALAIVALEKKRVAAQLAKQNSRVRFLNTVIHRRQTSVTNRRARLQAQIAAYRAAAGVPAPTPAA